jgi:hypothetical protein
VVVLAATAEIKLPSRKVPTLLEIFMAMLNVLDIGWSKLG